MTPDEARRCRHRRRCQRLRQTAAAVIVQTDTLPGDYASVVVCQITLDISSAADFRVTIEPTDANGLQTRSQVMANKPVTIRRERVGRVFGRFDSADIARLNIALAFVMGLAD